MHTPVHPCSHLGIRPIHAHNTLPTRPPIAMLIELAAVLLVSVHLMGCTWFLIASMQIGYGTCCLIVGQMGGSVRGR